MKNDIIKKYINHKGEYEKIKITHYNDNKIIYINEHGEYEFKMQRIIDIKDDFGDMGYYINNLVLFYKDKAIFKINSNKNLLFVFYNKGKYYSLQSDNKNNISVYKNDECIIENLSEYLNIKLYKNYEFLSKIKIHNIDSTGKIYFKIPTPSIIDIKNKNQYVRDDFLYMSNDGIINDYFTDLDEKYQKVALNKQYQLYFNYDKPIYDVIFSGLKDNTIKHYFLEKNGKGKEITLEQNEKIINIQNINNKIYTIIINNLNNSIKIKDVDNNILSTIKNIDNKLIELLDKTKYFNLKFLTHNKEYHLMLWIPTTSGNKTSYFINDKIIFQSKANNSTILQNHVNGKIYYVEDDKLINLNKNKLGINKIKKKLI